uniref:Uncharacterized protein n=1 Tax=Eutreptiella gymnastica TaxID=73025 RepID=A0A7S4D0L2_9EUGL
MEEARGEGAFRCVMVLVWTIIPFHIQFAAYAVAKIYCDSTVGAQCRRRPFSNAWVPPAALRGAWTRLLLLLLPVMKARKGVALNSGWIARETVTRIKSCVKCHLPHQKQEVFFRRELVHQQQESHLHNSLKGRGPL